MSGHGPQLLYSLPCYTPRTEQKFHTNRDAQYTVKKGCENPLVLRAQLPYDRNWGRSDVLPYQPGGFMIFADDADVPVNPFAVVRETDYRYLSHSAVDKQIDYYRYSEQKPSGKLQ